MGTPFYQSLDPYPVPAPVTPAASPSSPAGYAQVTPHGEGPAPYDIQAPLMDGEITAAFGESVAAGGAGVLYPQGARQAAASRFMDSAQGYGVVDVTASEWGGPGEDWPGDVRPG